MQHYRKADGSVWGFEADQLDMVTKDMALMTPSEFQAFKNPPMPAAIPTLTLDEVARAIVDPTKKTELAAKLALMSDAKSGK